MPDRIQLRRTKGWRKPEDAIVVARPSKWGNPFRVGTTYPAMPAPMRVVDSPRIAVIAFYYWTMHSWDHDPDNPEGIHAWLAPLVGRDLACWCPLGAPCHADVLLELANGATS
jgi:hypothetical protein